MEQLNICNYKVSTIIPIYNAEKYIEGSLKSIINQTIKPYEIIIVNDGSNDNSEIICKKIANVSKDIKIINLKKNKGVSYARNIGIKEAKGDYIHFMDSDDNIELDMYENCINEIKDKDVDIVMTGTIHNENGKITKYIPKKQLISNYEEMKIFIKENCISGRRDIFNVVWNKVYKKEFILNNKILFNENICIGEDFLFNCECLQKNPLISVIDQAFYNYMRRQNEVTLKMKFLNNKIELRKLFYQKWIDLYKFYSVYEDVAEKMEIYEGFKIYNTIISVLNKNCPLSNDEKIKFVSEFLIYENSNCLFKYMKKEKMDKELTCLKKKQIEEFFQIVRIKLLV